MTASPSGTADQFVGQARAVDFSGFPSRHDAALVLYPLKQALKL
jgi:hypothetical protein